MESKEIEYPTKFTKYKRILEQRNNSQNNNNTPNPENSSKSDKTKELNNNINLITTPISSPSFASSSTTSTDTSNNAFSSFSNNVNNNHVNHSPPKKLFINRSNEPLYQEAPLNLSTTSRSKSESSSSSSSLPSHSTLLSGDEKNKSSQRVESPSEMDTSNMTENMIIEDHFKRSLGSLYNSHIKQTQNSQASESQSSQQVPSGDKKAKMMVSQMMSNSLSPSSLFLNPYFALNSTDASLNALNAAVAVQLLNNNFSSKNSFLHSFPPPYYSPSFSHSLNLSPGHLSGKQMSNLSPKSASLHHSSSFNGITHKPSLSSKSNNHQRYTPPDSFQPYPLPSSSSSSSSSLLSSSFNTDTIKKRHVSRNFSNNQDAQPTNSSVSGSVDDHFSKSLGDVWNRMQANNSGSPKSASNHKAFSKSSRPSPPSYQEHNQRLSSSPSTAIGTFVPELEELIPKSVDDHFAKALGEKWVQMQQTEKSPTSPRHHHQNHPYRSSRTTSPSSPKSTTISNGVSNLVISPNHKLISPPSFFNSPSSSIVRS